MYPDFIGIGAQKAGTTWLYCNLQAHPQIWIPRKEVHYFDRKIHEQFSLPRRIFGKSTEDQKWRKQLGHWTKIHLIKKFSPEDFKWDLKFYLMPPNDRWYGSIFEPKKGRTAGEITPLYSVLDKDMVAHAHELMPHTKIIFMMRNPIERAWSQAVMSFDKVERGSVESVSEESLFRRFDRSVSRSLTNYLGTIENWGSYYPDDQIFVGFLEDVNFVPGDLLARLCEFLGIPPIFDAQTMNKKIHSRSVGKIPTNLAVHLARIYHDELVQLSERFGGYASFWLYCADRLINDTPEEESIPYPMWESYLWKDWVDSSKGAMEAGSQQLRSGPLSAIQTVK